MLTGLSGQVERFIRGDRLRLYWRRDVEFSNLGNVLAKFDLESTRSLLSSLPSLGSSDRVVDADGVSTDRNKCPEQDDNSNTIQMNQRNRTVLEHKNFSIFPPLFKRPKWCRYYWMTKLISGNVSEHSQWGPEVYNELISSLNLLAGLFINVKSKMMLKTFKFDFYMRNSRPISCF